jgi:hypothetical protein
MPATYTFIASNTLSTSAASVTFSSIPSTYTDLVLRMSPRDTQGATDSQCFIKPNSNSGTVYTDTRMTGNGSTAISTRNASNANGNVVGFYSASSATANTFGSLEVYIPNYAEAAVKQIVTFGTAESNAAEVRLSVTGGLFNNTTAISSLLINAGNNFVAGSSFFLYGIKNT